MKKRGLSTNFLSELKDGYLQPLVDYVKQDETLFFAIRENYINIYYRGGNLLKVESGATNTYWATFDTNYFKDSIIKLPSQTLSNKEQVLSWIEIFPSLKHEMDVFFSKKSKLEREFQQLVARENSYSTISNATDYFIVDIEYAADNARFDMIAIKWISNGTARRKINSCKLALIEMKYSDGALTGTSGIHKHIRDIEKISQSDMVILKEGAVNCFKQLRDLGLIKFSKTGNPHQIDELTDELPEFILVLANHDPASSILKGALETMPPLTNAELKFAVANFMGYGLFDEGMKNLKDFLKLL